VVVTKLAEKQLRKLPSVIKEAVVIWAASVEEDGIRNVRRLPGYHDEPLFGLHRGQRSVRLNRAYRLFYIYDEQTHTITITVLEVNKHDYK
jgi:toxin HigB-1